jgi:hypothetical protein
MIEAEGAFGLRETAKDASAKAAVSAWEGAVDPREAPRQLRHCQEPAPLRPR